MNNELKVYARSKNFLWTDSYIAGNMLQAHLDLDHDAASRNRLSIEKTVNWIHREIKENSTLIDLGCGPGLYAEKLASLGHKITGIDISENSIRYARESAQKNNLPITYDHRSYLDPIELGTFDVALCIYCDFGALIPSEQQAFLKNVHNSLNDKGVFIFDVFSEGLSTTKTEKRDFEIVDHADFWSDQPHYIMSETRYFEAEKAWGQRNIIIDEKTGGHKEFITWDTLFTIESITQLLEANGFSIETIEQSLVGANSFTSNDVLFVKAIKSNKKNQLKKESPSMDTWLREAKADTKAAHVGMFLAHNGVVRQTPKAQVRQGIHDGTVVNGMDFSFDSQKVDLAIEETYGMEGIYYIKVWLNEGWLEVGDDIMYVLIGGDIRPHVVDALQSLVEKIKTKCVVEIESKA